MLSSAAFETAANSAMGSGSNGTTASAFGSSMSAAANKLGSYVRLDPQAWQSVKEESQKRLEALRPWTEFFDRQRISKPNGYSGISQRLSFNLRYFQNNYILIVLLVIAYFLITQPWLLVSVAFLVCGFKWISSLPTNEPTVIAGKSFTQLQLWGIYAVISLILLFFTGISSTLFWVAFICALVVCGHAGFMDKPVEAEFEGDEQV